MNKFSVTNHYVGRSEKECAKLSEKTMNTAKWAEFEHGKISIDESCYMKKGKLCLSSNDRGIVQWRRGQYIHMYYCTDRKLGQLKQVVFPAKEPADV